MQSTCEIKLLVEVDDYQDPGDAVNAFISSVKNDCSGTQHDLNDDDPYGYPKGSVRIVGFQISTYQTD